MLLSLSLSPYVVKKRFDCARRRTRRGRARQQRPRRGRGGDAKLRRVGRELRRAAATGASVDVDSIRRRNRPNTAFRFRGCFDMRNPLQHDPGPRGPGARIQRGCSGRGRPRARALEHSSATRNRCPLGSDNLRSVDFPRSSSGEPPPAGAPATATYVPRIRTPIRA